MIGQIISNIQNILIFTVFLSVLIVFHEWGHFIIAKKMGVHVERFSLGFGPVIFSKIIDGTNFMVCLIPLGGYVKMQGDERLECKGTPTEFYSKSPGKRAWIIFNGSFVNYMLAFVCIIFVFMIGYPGGSTEIKKVLNNGPAETAGLMRGDKIIEFEGKKIYGALNFERLLAESSKDSVKIKVQRDGEKIQTEVSPVLVKKPDIYGTEKEIRDIGISLLSNKIGGIDQEFPAYQAGLRTNDEIIEIGSKPVHDWKDIQGAIADSSKNSISIKARRNDELITANVVPRVEEFKDEDGNIVTKKLIGISPVQELDLYKFGFFASIRNAVDELLFVTKTTYVSIYKMLTGSMSAKKVTGPVGIFYIVKGAARAGLSHILFVLGVISASLAIFNLLPVMPLDGGHLFLLGIEKIRGKALPQKIDDYIARTGFVLIICLALFVFYNDFEKMGLFDSIFKLFH